MSVNEEKLPAGKSVNSFIPFILKKHFKMPTHEERDAIFGYHFYRLLQRAKHISLIYNTQNDDFGSGEKSRFITQIINELDHLQINEMVLQSKVNSLNSIEPIIIDKSDSIKRKLEEWAAKRVSPTALTTFINCRLQFYFKYIAKIYPQDEIVEFMEANSFGTIIHEALCEAYTPHLHAPLRPQLLDEIKNTALTAITEGFQKELGERMNYGKNHLLYQVAQRLTTNYFEAENRFLSECEKTLYVTDVERSLSYSLNVKGMEFNLFGNVDRVDRVGDSVRIIDYKSGKVEQKDLSFKSFEELRENPKKAKAFQLMTYAYLYAKSVMNDISFTAANYSLRNLDDGPVFVKLNKTTLKMDALVMEKFEEELKILLLTIVEDENKFYPTDNKDDCQWCDFKSVCGR